MSGNTLGVGLLADEEWEGVLVGSDIWSRAVCADTRVSERGLSQQGLVIV